MRRQPQDIAILRLLSACGQSIVTRGDGIALELVAGLLSETGIAQRTKARVLSFCLLVKTGEGGSAPDCQQMQ